MEENYFFENTNSQNFTAKPNTISSIKLKKNKQSLIVFLSLFLMLFLITNKASAQVSITKPNLSIPVCSGFPSTYYDLGDIVITESQNSNFSTGTNRTLILTAPANFEFQASIGTVSINSSGNIDSGTYIISTTNISITYTCSQTNKQDVLTISGIKVRAINITSTGNITRTAGSADGTINGLSTGTPVTNTLTSTIATPPTTANAGSNQILTACATTTTLAGNTPSDGTGAWSVVSGTANITAPSSPTSGVTGLTLGTTVTLRWTISNGSCPTSTSDITITTAVGPGCLTYCTPTGNLNCTVSDYISNVTFNTLNNPSTCGAGGYTNYAATGAQTTSLLTGYSYNLNISVGPGTGTHGAGIWFDFNQNGSFSDTGEFFLISNSITPNTITSISIPIPIGAATGSIRMRIRYAHATNVVSGSGMSCTMVGTYGETEDYTINITAPAPCVAPTAQPTALILTPSSGTINGSFTAASPPPNNYLVVASTSATPPTPLNGTVYSKGSTLETGGYLVVDDDNNTTFSATGLTPGTIYYFHVFSYNFLCTGGPLYNIASPLFGTATTTAIIPSTYCTPSTTLSASRLYIKDVAFVGTLQDVTNNNNSFAPSSPFGFQNFTTLATKCLQAQGEGININVAGANSTSSNRGHWKVWVDWNKDGTFSDTVERVYDSGNIATATTSFGFIIPPTTAPGDYRIRIRFYNTYKNSNPGAGDEGSYSYNFSPCQTFGDGTSQSGYTDYGEAEDYLFTVQASCSAVIKTVTGGQNCGTGTITLTAAGSTGTTSYKWYNALSAGSLVATTSAGTWTTPSLINTTSYYVTALNGSCESQVRTEVIATVNPTPTLTFTPSAPEVCGEDTVLTLTASGDKQQVFLINENFENGLNGFSNSIINNNTAVNSKTAWQSRTSTFVPAEQVWFPAMSSGFGTNKFVMATSDVGSYTQGSNVYAYNVENALLSPTINSTTFLDLTLSFKIFYSRYFTDGTNLANDYVSVQISTNGGGAWTEITRYTADVGIGTRFENKTFNLNTYINQSNLKVRIVYHGEWCDGVAIDDVKLFGFKALGTALNWTGTSLPNAFTNLACTIPYTAGSPAVTVYIKPTLTQLEQGTFTFTASALLSNGCSASTPITITNKSKVWKGTTSTDWNDAGNWLPAGVPTASTCVIIPTGKISKIINNPDAFAKTVTIKAPTGNLELQSEKNLTVTDNITVENGAIFNVRNSASLVQINNTINTGIVNVARNSTAIKKLDYTYWSSPVTPFTLGQFSTANSYMYSWIPTVAMSSGNWQPESNTTAMIPGKGYIIRTPWGHTENTIYTAAFNGTPNNGDITTPISKGTLIGVVDVNAEDDEWNLIGNPYPSGLSIAKFIDLPSNVPVVDGTVYLWTHNSQPSTAAPNPFYGDFVFNYTSEDYATVNKTGATVTTTAAATGGGAPSEFIASGQSFFIKAATSMANGTTANATFTNSMRETGKNNSFSKIKTTKETEKNRIWLNLANNSDAFSQLLVGYLAGATQGLDRGFDGENLGGNDVTFYSIIPEANLTIQGRALPFDENDQVNLGYNAAIAASLSIRIDHIDGLFDTQNIYLEDKELDIIHDLKKAPYVFTTEIGDFDKRFVLRYTNKDKTLGTNSVETTNDVLVIVNQKVTVKSSNEQIKSIDVFDLAGRKIDSYKAINTAQFTLNHLNKNTVGLILKITLENDTVLSKKIIY